jgi:hypothetical protein
MRITMEFSLPEEEQEYRDAREGAALRRAMREFAEKMRQRFKYDEKPPDGREISDMFYDALAEENLEIWEDA